MIDMYLSEACKSQAVVLWLVHVAQVILLKNEQLKHMNDGLSARHRLQIAAPHYSPPPLGMS